MKKLIILISLIGVSIISLSPISVQATETVQQEIPISVQENSFETSDKVIMNYDLTYDDGTVQKTTLIADKIDNTNSISEHITNSPNKNSVCTNGTYWFGCEKLKVYTSVGVGESKVEISLYVNISSASGGTTQISNISTSYNKTYRTTITKALYRSIDTTRVPYGQTAKLEYKMGARNTTIGNIIITSGLQVKGSLVTVYGT